jgi:hypothetical protein
MAGRRDIQADDSVELLDEGGIVGQLEAPPAVLARPCSFQMSWTVETAIPTALAIQWVASAGGGASVRRTTSATRSSAIGALPGGRVLSLSSPSMPASMNRSCQRHTHVFDLPVAIMMPWVPMPSSVRSTIRARQTCFCGVFGAAMMVQKRRRSAAVADSHAPERNL